MNNNGTAGKNLPRTWSTNCPGVASPLPEALPETLVDADKRTLASCKAFCGQPSCKINLTLKGFNVNI